MMRPLILVGGGGHCKSVIDAADSAGYNILGILDVPENVGNEILGIKVIGTDNDIPYFVDESDFIITVGFIKNPLVRIRIYNTIKKYGGVLGNVMASTAHVSKFAQIGTGISIHHFANVNAGVVLGDDIILNTHSNIGHDVIVGSHTHISTGVMVCGECRIGQRCFIGSQSVIRNGISICDDAIIGTGSVIVKDITQPGIYVGQPAVLLKKH